MSFIWQSNNFKREANDLSALIQLGNSLLTSTTMSIQVDNVILCTVSQLATVDNWDFTKQH